MSKLAIIDVEALSHDDDFLKYEPKIQYMRYVKTYIITAIESNIKNFYVPMKFKKTKVPKKYLIEKGPHEWWEMKANDFSPYCGSRIGTRKEYCAFLGVLIKKFVEKGVSIEDAWHIVCFDSSAIKNYANLNNKVKDTKSYSLSAIIDLCKTTRTLKVLATDNENEGYWLDGGPGCHSNGFYPLSLIKDCSRNYSGSAIELAVSWIIVPK